MLAFLLTLALLYPPTFMGEELVAERAKGLTHLAHVLGARCFDHFLGHLIADLSLLLLPTLTALVVGFATGSPAFQGVFAAASAALLLCFAVAICCMTYLVSFVFSSPQSVLKYLSTILLFATTLPLCLLFSLSVTLPNTAHAAAQALSVFPGVGLSWSLLQVATTAILAHELERSVPVEALFVRTADGHAGAAFYMVVMVASALVFFLISFSFFFFSTFFFVVVLTLVPAATAGFTIPFSGAYRTA